MIIGDHLLDELTALRHRLHRRPETGFDVGATADMVAERLRVAGLEVTTGVGGGVVATLRRGRGQRSLGLRADLDALPVTERNTFAHASEIPGAFHGCGHDGHTTMLVGAALLLAARDDLDGTVHFVFQPSEENGLGAQAMIDDGLFERFPMDAIFGLHNLPGLPLGHASAPELTVDPIVVGAQVVLALQTIVSRALAPRDHGVVSVTELVTDGARNIIPSHVTIRGDVRGFDDRTSELVCTRMEQLATGVATANGATARLTYEREFAPVVNTAEEVAAVVRAAEQMEGAVVDLDHGPVGFSEDFAQFLAHRPGCFVLLGNGAGEHHGTTLHHPGYDFNDAALPLGVGLWCRLVWEHLRD